MAAAADLAQVNERYAVELRLIGSMRQANNSIRDANIQRRSMEGSRRTDEEKEERVEAIELRKTNRMQRFNTLYETRLRTHLEEQAETAVFPLIKADTRREIVNNFRDAGMPAMADLIESLPGTPPEGAREGVRINSNNVIAIPSGAVSGGLYFGRVVSRSNACLRATTVRTVRGRVIRTDTSPRQCFPSLFS